MPTKTEQTDLLQTMFGRNGESPVAIVAPQSPSDCFDMAIMAARMAVRAMTPVFILSEGFRPIALSLGAFPMLKTSIRSRSTIRKVARRALKIPFLPYARDPVTLARPWAISGTPGFGAPCRWPRARRR